MKTYFALSVVAPAGDDIRSGKKRLEIRKWQPERLPLQNLLIVQNQTRLSHSGPVEDSQGRVVALVDVVGVKQWEEADLAISGTTNWEPGWVAWILQNVRPLNYPSFVPARLRIYEVELPEVLNSRIRQCSEREGSRRFRPYAIKRCSVPNV